MALKIEVGDLFNAVAQAEGGAILVHGCNAQGVMGSGVAAIVKKLYPESYEFYKDCHSAGKVKLGNTIVWGTGELKVVVAHAITQKFYGRDGKKYVDYDAVVECMEDVRTLSQKLGIPVHLPMIGGGLGGGDTKRLTAVFQAVFHDVDATLWLKEG